MNKQKQHALPMQTIESKKNTPLCVFVCVCVAWSTEVNTMSLPVKEHIERAAAARWPCALHL